MDLIESISNKKGSIRGITLNSQNIDLFNIIEESKSHEEAAERVYQYLSDILFADKMSSSGEMSLKEKIQKIVNEKANIENKDEFLKFLLENGLQIRANWDSKEELEQLFKGQHVDSTYIDQILDLKKYFAYQTHGILSFLVDEQGKTIDPKTNEKSDIDKEKTYQKVEALHDYIVGSLENGENRFNRLTLDGQGKFGTVAGVMRNEKEANSRPEDYNLKPLRQGYEFAKKHGMDVRINALVFFKDFPDRLVGCDKTSYETALINYGRAIASIAKEYEQKGVSTTIDMFNEFVDYYEPFSERTNKWMSKLSIEDLCKVALAIKKEMPEVDFGYNDWNYENPKKRQAIFAVMDKIQAFEKENNCEGQIMGHIGMECHTNINKVEQLRDSIEEAKRYGLPIDVTELDISKGLKGVDYEEAERKYKEGDTQELLAIKKYEQKLQNEIMQILNEYVQDGTIRSITAWSITDELCCDFCDGKEASIIETIYDGESFSFSGKDMDKIIEMTEEEMQLIEKNKERSVEKQKSSINKNPIQDYCYHTHTERCGHAAKDTSDEEFIEHAIKSGMKKIAFTDHMPLPDGLNKRPNSRMDIAELDSYLKSIDYFKQEYSDEIEIESGFEFEYSDRDLEHLQSLKSKTDKMILGQHFVVAEKGKEFGVRGAKDDKILELYVSSIEKAIDKGLPDIIAHPDLFMQARDTFGVAEEEATRRICQKAIEKGIPLEINFGYIAPRLDTGETLEEIKKDLPYPSPEFWKFVAEETVNAPKDYPLMVVFGKDAHFPDQLSETKDYELAKQIIGTDTLSKLHFVKSDLKTHDAEILGKLGISRSDDQGVLSSETIKQFAREPSVVAEKGNAAESVSYLAKQEQIDKGSPSINES